MFLSDLILYKIFNTNHCSPGAGELCHAAEEVSARRGHLAHRDCEAGERGNDARGDQCVEQRKEGGDQEAAGGG